MTIPTLMNCSHSGDGWCLECVSTLEEKRENLNNLLKTLYGMSLLSRQAFAYQVFEFLEKELEKKTWKK